VTQAVKSVSNTAKKSIDAVRKRADAEISRLAGSARR